MYGVFEKSSPVDDDEEKETEVFVLKSAHFTIKPHSKLKNIWTAVINQFDDRIDNLLMKESGYSLTEVLKIHVEIAEKIALRYSCQDPEFRSDIATESIYGKKHLINVNSQYSCFLACLAFHVLKRKPHGNQEVAESDFINSLNFIGTGIYPPYKKPIGIYQIKKLLKANKKLLGDIQINIFGLFSTENQEIYAYETGIDARIFFSSKTVLWIQVALHIWWSFLPPL